MAASLRNIIFGACRYRSCLTCCKNVQPLSFYISRVDTRSIHSTSPKLDLMEFFDDPKNWGAREVKSGRSWKIDELRLKSNVDLQKLWYVLLKERNMLMTMEYNSEEQVEVFPNPERIDKVAESMDRIEEVVRERNEAYWQLEVGESAPKGSIEDTIDPNDPLGLVRKAAEALIELAMGAKHSSLLTLDDIDDFCDLTGEKRPAVNSPARRRNIQRRSTIKIIKKLPDFSTEILRKKTKNARLKRFETEKKITFHY
nr:EOG090X0DBE [Leptodora kindtii]